MRTVPVRSRLAALPLVLPLALAAPLLAACGGGDAGTAAPLETGPALPTPTASPGEAVAADFATLLTATFSGNHDLDRVAARLRRQGVDDAGAMVQRLNARAEAEGLPFRVGEVDPGDVTDITCYDTPTGLWLREQPATPDPANDPSGADGPAGVDLTLGASARGCGDTTDVRYRLLVRVGPSGPTVSGPTSGPVPDPAGTARLARVAQALVDGAPPVA